MARLNFDTGSEAFFELILTDREEGYGAIAQLRVPKGAGRSSFVLYEEFVWGDDPGECKSFIARLNPAAGGHGISFLRNDSAYFSFWRRPDGSILFEARCFTACGEIGFRADVTSEAVACFHKKLERTCAAMCRAKASREGDKKGQKG